MCIELPLPPPPIEQQTKENEEVQRTAKLLTRAGHDNVTAVT